MGKGDTIRVSHDSLFPVFSTTKGIAATAVHRVVERNRVSYDRRISEVWPEFGAAGKREITLRQALSHSAGIPCMPVGLDFAQLADWDSMCAAIARLAPMSPPGEQTVYHAMTYGWIVGEFARRVDGRPFREIFEQEIAQPLGTTEMFIGLPVALDARVATLEETNPPAPEVDDRQPQVVPGWIQPLHRSMERRDVRGACIPATNGLMSARAIARHYAALLPSGADGVRLLSDATLREATTPSHARAPEWGLGYQLGGTVFYPESDRAFGHGGYGGSIGVADRELDLAIGVTKNRFCGDDTVKRIVREIRGAVMATKRHDKSGSAAETPPSHL
jgi:CubicO group peptidase (beta-lactamase class C family)